MTKLCARCRVEKPYDEFHVAPRMKSGRSSYCKPCSADYAREAYAKNPERARATQRAYASRVRTPEMTRRRHLWAMYRLRVEDYDDMVAAQGSRCAICKTDAPGGRGNWHVDHCHDTGKVRALLCAGCNVGIAQLGHDPERLRRAAIYLEQHASKGVSA